MGKRENEASKKSKKHKRHKSQKKKTEILPFSEEEAAELSDSLELVPQDEIQCDGEVEIPLDEEQEADSVDVEMAEEEVMMEETEVQTEILTPPKASTSKAAAAAATEAALANRKPNSASKLSPSLSTSPNTLKNKDKTASSKKRRDSGTSSEEERWLTAIESGKLMEMDDELKKIKDPKLMTARQRAMYERNQNESDVPSPGVEMLMSLPTGYKEKEKPQTAEEIQRAALKNLKRKQMADEKREKDKKKTVERLLKKQDSKQRSTARNKQIKPQHPVISYRNSLLEGGTFIQMPPEMEFPLKAQIEKPAPVAKLCGIAGCGQRKVYNCSKTNLPLCSFACYRKNVESLKQIMC